MDNVKDIDVLILMYNLIEYSDNYLKISGSLWQYCRNKLAVNTDTNIVDLWQLMLLIRLTLR